MANGYTFDAEMRDELVEAVLKYKENIQDRADLNKMIMKIQQPYIDKLDRIKEVLDD